ncbi:MAG: hypothetical protein WC703_00440 [Candidatus Neomarinimicrobiota bacterium]
MKRLIFCLTMVLVTAVSAFSEMTTIFLINGGKIEGKPIGLKKDELFVVSGKSLFVIDTTVIERISRSDSVVRPSQLATQRQLHINYNAFDAVVELNKNTVWSYSTWDELVKLTGNLNPPTPPFPDKSNLSANKKNYLTIKPARLILQWTDLTYGRRLKKYQAEVRFSYSYSKNLAHVAAEPEEAIFEIHDLNIYTFSIRRYQKPNLQGLYYGIGAGGGTFHFDPEILEHIFSFNFNEDSYKFGFIGGLLEAGFAGTPFTHFISSPSACLAVGSYYAKEKGGDWHRKTKLKIVPSVNWTFGFLW